jgi:hypothetical protein
MGAETDFCAVRADLGKLKVETAVYFVDQSQIWQCFLALEFRQSLPFDTRGSLGFREFNASDPSLRQVFIKCACDANSPA